MGTHRNYLYTHFRRQDHSCNDMGIQIVENVDSSVDITERELFWINILNTAYPFGLNDNIKGYGNISEGVLPSNVGKNPYFSIQVKRTKKKEANVHAKEHVRMIKLLVYLRKLPYVILQTKYET